MGGRWLVGVANKQTGTILISPPRDIPLPSSLGDCHAQVEPACIIAQLRRHWSLRWKRTVSVGVLSKEYSEILVSVLKYLN